MDYYSHTIVSCEETAEMPVILMLILMLILTLIVILKAHLGITSQVHWVKAGQGRSSQSSQVKPGQTKMCPPICE